MNFSPRVCIYKIEEKESNLNSKQLKFLTHTTLPAKLKFDCGADKILHLNVKKHTDRVYDQKNLWASMVVSRCKSTDRQRETQVRFPAVAVNSSDQNFNKNHMRLETKTNTQFPLCCLINLQTNKCIMIFAKNRLGSDHNVMYQQF